MKSRTMLIVIAVLLILGCGACLFLGALSMGSIGNVPISFGNAVAVIYVEGTIMMGGTPSQFSTSQSAYSDQIIADLRSAQKDPSVKAIVLRIESPGGSVVASREIYDEIIATRAKGKPIVASMGEVAASGGYYIAAGADKIYAHPGTLTGSIGVISVMTNIEGLAEKIGLKMIVVKSGAHKDETFGYRDFTPEERDIWQRLIDEAYEDFVDVVATGRHLDVATVKTLADGRVYTGKQAKEFGLTDELGNLDAAIAAAAKLGKISGTPRTIKYKHQSGFLQALSSAIIPQANYDDLANLFGINGWGRLMYMYVVP